MAEKRVEESTGMRGWFGAVLIALAVLALPFVNQLAIDLLRPPPEAPAGAAADGDTEALRAELRIVQRELAEFKDTLAELRERGFERDEELSRILGESVEERETPLVGEGDQFAQVMLLTGRRSVNSGVARARQALFMELFGPPREELGDDCQPVTNPMLEANLATENVGPIRATMLRPALDSLRSVFDAVREYEPVLYEKITSAGSLCVRRIRGSEDAASTHAYGASVDLNIDGYLDTLGDGKTQFGLILLAEFFNEAGWYWGASFAREDSMHFEVGEALIRQWVADGSLIVR